MSARDRYPDVRQFAGYFNEDWTADAPTWEGLVDFYVSHTTVTERRPVVAQLRQLLLDCRSDAELDQAVRELSIRYWPPPQTYREWLIDVRDRLEASIES